MCEDAWYIIAKAADARDGYEDIENSGPRRRNEYQTIAQFDYQYQQTGIRDASGENPTYADVVAGSSSQPKNSSSDNPPSYSAVVKGGVKLIRDMSLMHLRRSQGSDLGTGSHWKNVGSIGMQFVVSLLLEILLSRKFYTNLGEPGRWK